MSRLKDRRIIWTLLRLAFAGAALFFLIRAVVTQWSQFTAYPWQLRWAPLVASFALQLVAAFFWATAWWIMVSRAGSPVPWSEGVRVYLISNLVKYVPGSIWGYVSRVHLAKDLTAMGVGVSVIWEVGTAVVASLLLTASALPFYPGETPALVFRLVALVALLCLVGLLPPVANRWLRFLNQRQATPHPITYGWRDFSIYLASALTTHILVGSAFYLLVLSVVDLSMRVWWSFVAMWSFSATAGLVIFLVPYGLGVKEGTLALLMAPFLPHESAAPIALASRLWTILGELLAAGVVALAHLVRNHRQAAAGPGPGQRRARSKAGATRASSRADTPNLPKDPE